MASEARTRTTQGQLYDDGSAAWYDARANVEGTALASEANTTATRNSSDITNHNGSTLRLVVVTANKAGTTATYTPSIQWKYDGTNYVTIWTAASALTNNGSALYDFGPGVADVGGGVEAVEMTLPRTFRVVLTVATADGSNNMDTAAYYALGR